MAILSDAAIEHLLRPYLQSPVPVARVATYPATLAPLAVLVPALSAYLDLLLRWNERTNLTAIRNPEQIVQRHFGESLFAGRVLADRLSDGATVLDIGSGAGFPGLPVQLMLPNLKVTLAESQGKKSAFLREALRETGAKGEVWPARAQDLAIERRFGAVTMRAVDRPAQALAEARRRLQLGGCLLHLCGATKREEVQDEAEVIAIPGLNSGVIELTLTRFPQEVV